MLAGVVALAYRGLLIPSIALATLLSFLYERYRDDRGWNFADFAWRELPLLTLTLFLVLS